MSFTKCKPLFLFLISLFSFCFCFSQNAIITENNLSGTSPSVWDISGAGDVSIQGFATDISVNKGETVHFKIKTNASNYTINIYRLGYYQGNGARFKATVNPSVSLPQTQPADGYDAATGKTDCGNWAESASWQVPADAVSGIYVARLTRADNNGSSHIVFVVRDDAGTSKILFKTADATWQAYNNYGGNSLYVNGSGTSVPGFNHATKVSYNRPFYTRNGGGGGGAAEDWLFNAEYPMLRWLERNGYDVSYTTDLDMDRSTTAITPAIHKILIAVGHDEYWSATQRSRFENARNAGVNLAFFDGNEVYWKTRWEDNNRTLVCYKEGTLGENVCNAKCDPLANAWTGSWRDGCGAAYGSNDGCRPENALSGQISWDGTTSAIQVPDTYKNLRFWRNTSVATLGAGQTATFSAGTLGYEWDWEQYKDSYPSGRITMSSTTTNGHTHKLSLYRHSSGALVFGAGTVQWSWGLDGTHDRGGSTTDVRMQQATVNLFADMGVQPGGALQPGLSAATASADNIAPSSVITTPANGTSVSGGTVTVSGTASDIGGIVAGVEVSVDGGATWQVATGSSNWNYSFTPSATGTVVIKSRSFDDIGNIESAGTAPAANAVTVTVSGVAPGTCPCTVFQPTDVPASPLVNDGTPIELGMKFRTSQDGTITGVRYYKGLNTSGLHKGHLWSSSGVLLAEADFVNETASGWQQVSFSTPVPVAANTTYVVSFFSPSGDYAFTNPYFTNAIVNGPVRGLANGEDGPNGVYKYTGVSAFPSDNYQSSNYSVDVVFNTVTATDVTPPTIISVSPYNGATGVSASTVINVTFDEAIDAATVNNSVFELRDDANVLVPSAVSYNGVTHIVTISPSAALGYSKTYTVIVKGGVSDPRVKDLSGNALSVNFTISFTTSAIVVVPPVVLPSPNEGAGGPILVISSSSNPFSRYPVEILRAEGLNEFSAMDISQVTSAVLNNYEVVILGEMPSSDLPAAKVTMLTDWVTAGGTFIAMKPSSQLSTLLGISAAGNSLTDKYLLVNTASGAGTGIVNQTIQYHGSADQYTLAGATSLATLYSDATSATVYPAVTTRSVGANGGVAVAFTYDLAKSIVYTRQGNPAWEGQKRDGQSGPVRSDDQFFPDWIDFNKVAIPQADEQQHLLSNIIIKSNLHHKPLPKFWFLPKGLKAAVVMTGDNHGDNGMKPRFDINISESTPGCSVDDWECIRSTGYLYPGTTFTAAQAKQYNDLGFEVALHINTNCENFTAAEFQNFYSIQSSAFHSAFPDVPLPVTNRTHCIAWPSYTLEPEMEFANGIRLDANYYYWPASWINNRPGMFTGSGMPMRFAKADGTLIDCYQAVTQMPDESGESFPQFCNALLDKAIGQEGYYGVFTTNIHFDNTNSAEANSIVASAKARGIPVVTAKQMLTWLDGRNSSSFGPMTWNGNTLSFAIVAGSGARNLKAMLPVASQNGQLTSITKNGSAVTFTNETIKGIQYAFFDATSADYVASYSADIAAPVITQVVATPHSDGTATITWITDEASDSKVIYGSTAGSMTSSSNNGALVTSHTITLNSLSNGTTYYFRVVSADALSNSATEPVTLNVPLSFTMPSVCALDQITSDFLLSPSLDNVIVTGEGDGAVILSPVLNEDFSGSTVPAGWSEGLFNPGATTLANGSVNVNGTHIFSNNSYGPGSIIEFNATYNLGSYQNIGFSFDQPFNDAPWITIGQGGNPDGNLYARASDGTSVMLGSLLGSPHKFRIKWNANNFEFYVDDLTTPSATINLVVGTNMFLQISDVLNNDGSLSVDWLRVTPYSDGGTFTSRVIDGGSVKNWGAASWNALVPAGTSIQILVRTSNSLTPDNAWSAFTPIANSGASIGVASRYIQYRAILATTDKTFTPVLKDLSIDCADAETTPPVIVTKNITIQSDVNGLAFIQPQDVIVSVTDNSGVDNSSIQVSQLQFSCSDKHQAYTAPMSSGNQNWEGTLGMEFRVNQPAGIIINQLGAFDHLGDGIKGNGVRVAIFNKTSQTIVPGLNTLITGDADSHTGNYRMKNITPVTLLPGDYVVVSLGYNSLELNGNSVNGIPQFPTGDLANGAISYIGSSLYGDNNPDIFSYPTHPDQYSNQYLAGNFVYATATGGNQGDNIVTVTAKDIYGNEAQATATVTLVCASSPIITQQPVSQSVCEGNPVTYESGASGSPSPTVQWQVSTNGTAWSNIPGATNSSYSFNPTFADNNKQYRAVWTIQSSETSSAATLTVNQLPVAGITTSASVLTCATSTINLTATGGGTYKWEDNSTNASRTLTAAGTYTVTVTGSGGCTATQSVTISSNKTVPSITPLTGGTLTCATTSIAVTATATGQGALSYAWSGGTQGASANIRNFTVAGTYTVTVTDAVNGCSSTASVLIGSSVGVPVAGITNNSGTTTLNCLTGAISVTATGGGTYKWEDNSTSASRTLTAVGTYTVTVTGSGGCTATQSVTISSNKTVPVITPLTGGTLTCATTSIAVTATATGQGALSYAWSGGTQGASANIRNFTVAGTYTVTVTDAVNGCSSTASVTIGSSVGIPVAGITNNSGTTTLTCLTGAISVTATGGGTYKWEDNSTTASRTLTAAGSYTVTVTGSGGCTATQSVTISSNKTVPVITPLTGGTLTCATTSIAVTATATGQGALSYAWSGGTQGASANIRNFTVAGTYTVTVTDAVNGCSSTASVTIGSSVGVPVAGITNNSGTTTLTCLTGTISVTATGGRTYKWEDNSTSASRTLTAVGTYTVTVTGSGGCTATQSVTISSNKTVPVITPLTGGTLTCATTSIAVTATATGQGALSYAWSGGTQGASANIRNFTVAGTYTVTVTDAVNGCSSTASVLIGSSVGVPVAGITNNSGTTTLTCLTGAISVTATGGGTYKWEDNSTTASRTLTAVGTYTVTVTGSGGCTATQSVTISSNKTVPVITPLTGGTLTCATTSIAVTATATGQGALSYTWSGGTQGASANIRNFTVAGTYTVTVTDAVNGCSSTASVTIGSSVGVPVAGITNNSGTTTLTCLTGTISVTATGGGTYKWEDNSTNASRTLTAAGTYTVTVTGTGGCTATKSITVTGNKTGPAISPLSGGTLSCSVSSISVTASATGQGALTYAWSGGTQGASANVRVFTVAGTYSVTVTDAANGCSSVASVTISGSSASNIAITNNSGTSVLTCTNLGINLTATGGGTYKWNDNTTSANKIVTAPGTYSVAVTQTGGCTATTSITITANKTAPAITPLTGGTITCTATSVSVTAAATGQGALSYNWSGGTQGAASNIRVFTVAGTYSLTVTDAANGCSSTASAVIGNTGTTPAAAITNNSGTTVLTCSVTGINVTATGGVSYKWNDLNTSATRTFAAAGTYTVTVTGSGGCTATKSITLTSNKTTPVIAPLSGGTLSCTVSSVSVTAAATGQGALSYLWSGGTQGATSNARTFTSAGTYSVTVTDAATGCSSNASVTIASVMTPPSLTSSLTPIAINEIPFTYAATSSISGTTFSWSRAAVTGIGNAAASGAVSAVSETLINTTRSAINVVYVYTLKYNGCTNTQNVTVKVNPSTAACVTTSSIVASYYSFSVPSGKYLWINSVFAPSKMGTTGKVNFYIYNSKVTYNGNNGIVTINLPYSHIVFDAGVSTASTKFVNNVWETVIPMSFTKNAFMNGIAYPVPAGGINGGMRNSTWTADIAIDKAGVELQWKTTVSQYSYLSDNAGLNVKPVDGYFQNPYTNNDVAGTPQNYSAYYNYNIGYSDSKSVYCNTTLARGVSEIAGESEPGSHLGAIVMPNPSRSYFTLALKGSDKSPLVVKVLDVYGRVISVHEKVSANTNLRLGEMWTSGTYFAEVTQGKEKVIIKLIKLK